MVERLAARLKDRPDDVEGWYFGLTTAERAATELGKRLDDAIVKVIGGGTKR